MKKILLTGFEKFHTASSNPSEAIVKELETQKIPGLITAVLPVTFGESWQKLKTLIDTHSPDLVIALGQAEGRSQITPEKIAINLEDARIPDNGGNQPTNQPIIAGGPDGLFSTLPIEKLVDHLKKQNIPAGISLTAGTFVCNHLFYSLQHYGIDKDFKSGFIHVPLMDSQASEFSGLPTLPLDTLVMAIKEILTLLFDQP